MFYLFPFRLMAQQFDGGFFFGLSMSQVEGDNYSGYNKAGITGGGYILRNLNRDLDFRMELRFIQKGSFKGSTDIDPSYYKVSLDYIELPLLIQYKLSRKVLLAIGVSPDVLLYSKEEDESGPMPPELHPKFMRFSAGANFDASYALTGNIYLGARFTYSMLRVREHGGGVTYLLNRGWYNNVISFSGYYQF